MWIVCLISPVAEQNWTEWASSHSLFHILESLRAWESSLATCPTLASIIFAAWPAPDRPILRSCCCPLSTAVHDTQRLEVGMMGCHSFKLTIYWTQALCEAPSLVQQTFTKHLLCALYVAASTQGYQELRIHPDSTWVQGSWVIFSETVMFQVPLKQWHIFPRIGKYVKKVQV